MMVPWYDFDDINWYYDTILMKLMVPWYCFDDDDVMRWLVDTCIYMIWYDDTHDFTVMVLDVAMGLYGQTYNEVV